MPRNTEGLKRSARLRSESAMQRALAALQRMDASEREINFRTVAAEAGVSAAWLYGQEGLRGRIVRSRRNTTDVAPPASASRNRERASRQNIVATLRLRIKNLEEKNRELTGLLELVYGELALAREQNASVGNGPLAVRKTSRRQPTLQSHCSGVRTRTKSCQLPGCPPRPRTDAR
jgi:hypothetical protein